MALVDFIIKAKTAGYATGGEDKELKFNDGSKGFTFSSDGYRYIDRYYGFNPFSGTEHVYETNEVLIWKMNYYGEILDTSSDPKNVYAFLREAMSSITPEYPFRGPANLKKGSLSYQNVQNGTLQSFYGNETIFDDGKMVYYLDYHGGKMKMST
jgi:hypothetical protein